MTFILEIKKKYEFKKNENSKLIVLMVFSKNDIDLSDKSYFEFNNKKYNNEIFKKYNNSKTPILKFLYFSILKFINVDEIKLNEFLFFVQKQNFFCEPEIKDKYFSINNLFIEDNAENSLIGKCWTIIYSIPEMIEFSNIFSFDLEKELLNSTKILFQKFDKLNKKDILDFTNSMNEYMKKDSILWKIEYNNFPLVIKEKNNKELKSLLQICEKEKEQINKINSIDDWSKENSIRKLDELINTINNKISNIQNDHEKNMYLTKLNTLFININDNKNEFLKLLKNKINNIIQKGEDLKTNYLKYEKYINTFLQKNIEKNKIEKIIPNLIFPNKVEEKNNFEDFFIFEFLIWYSKNYHIINKIFNKNINKLDKIHYISEIDEKNEYRIIYNFVVYLFFDEEEELTENNINRNIIISTLNSIFIEKIYSYIEKNYKNDNIDEISNFLFDTIKGIDKKINDLMERKNIDQKEIKWAYNLLKEITYDFNIILPKFNYEDIKYLFLRNGNGCKYSLGPLLRDSKINVKDCEQIFENYNEVNKEKNYSDYYHMDLIKEDLEGNKVFKKIYGYNFDFTKLDDLAKEYYK